MAASQDTDQDSRSPVRVIVAGATGRMGSEVVRAVLAQPDLRLVACLDVAFPVDAEPLAAGCRMASDRSFLEGLEADVWVDFTVPDSVLGGVRWALERGIVPLVGTTGLDADAREEIAGLCERVGKGCLLAPNFALGAVLLMKFAAEAARYFPAAEIVELHHDRKLDAPSGTARLTAERMTAARFDAGLPLEPIRAGDESIEGVRGGVSGAVRVHSLRLPGLLAHQEVLLGGTGEVLTLRHDSLSRESFMPGVVLAIRKASTLQGLVVGLEHLL